MSRSLTVGRCLHLFEKRLHQRPDPRGLTVWIAITRGLVAQVYRALAEARANHAATKRDAYGQLMLAETELKQLRSELAHSPKGSQIPQSAEASAKVDSILERIYAAKGILSAIALSFLLWCEFTPTPTDDPERRRTQRVIRVTAKRIEELPLC